MDLSEFRTAVRTRIGANANDTFHTAARVDEAVNSAIEVFSTEFRWPWLLASTTVSISSASITPPADWAYTETLVLQGEPQPLQPGSLVDIDVLAAQQGAPVIYADGGSTILVAPTPDRTYPATLRYFRVEEELTGTSDEPLAPARFHPVIVAYAAYLRLAAENRAEEAQVAIGEYQGRVARLAKQEARVGRPRRPRVRPGHGWG